MRVLWAMLCMAAAGAATAQLREQPASGYRMRFTTGQKFGINYSQVYDAEGEDFETLGKAGIATGLFFSVPISRLIGIQPEVLFSQKGFRATGTLNGSGYSMTRTTSYLDVPVLAALKPGEYLTVFAGPQFSCLLLQTDVFTHSAGVPGQEQLSDDTETRKNTICLTGGIDVNIRHFVAGVRVGIDLFDNRRLPAALPGIPRYKNIWLQGSIAFRI